VNQQSFSLAFSSLTQLEIACTRAFFDRLDAKGVTYFSSDTFRKWKLDKRFTKPETEIGLLFMKLSAQGFIESFGELPSQYVNAKGVMSNHFRKNDMFQRTGKFERWLREQQRLML
jgi:hypothetical protein